MQIRVNGKPTEIAEQNVPVRRLLEILSVEAPRYVSVQINGAFVDRRDFARRLVAPGDEVEFLYFMGGGSLSFTPEQMERYSRQIILREVGVKGQKKLLASKVLVIGTGGLGSPAAMYLAAAGVGTIGLVDYDAVDLSNLQRQIIHTTANVGRAKTASARETLANINPEVQVVTYQERVAAANILDIIHDRDYDFIIDGTDNFPAKFLINDACVLAGKPFSHAGVIRLQGQTMTYVPGQGPCYRCVFQAPPPPDTVPTCRQAGVLGAVVGVIATLQATEALKYLLGVGQLLIGTLLTFDAYDMDFRKISLPRNPHCPVCGETPTITKLVDAEQTPCDWK